jgi:sugar lactone lactonase YvrE
VARTVTTCKSFFVTRLSIFVVGSLLAAAGIAAGCVGDDPGGGNPPAAGPDGSTPCTGAGCVDSGGPSTNDSGGPSDSGADTAPPACSKIQVTTLAGSVEGATNGAGNIATFKGPEGITVDPATGTLFVADTGNRLVRKVLSNGTTSTHSTTTPSGAWISPRHASFPAGFNSLFISDHGHDQVFGVSTNGTAASDFALGSLQAFAVQPTTFQKFVVSSTRVAKWIPGGGIEATVFSGTFDSGFVDGAAAGARYANLLDLAFDGTSILYVADQGNHRVRKVVVATGTTYGDVSTVAGSATAGHVDGTGTAAQFEGPNGFAIDQTSHLVYVADGATIRVMTPAGVVTTLVGSSSAYLDGDGCTAKFINVKSITKFANELYVLDVNRIRKIVMN